MIQKDEISTAHASDEIRSMYNNIKLSANRKKVSYEALFYLRFIKETTGRSYQNILAELVIKDVKEKAKSDETYRTLVENFNIKASI
jgi:hypothetical protein